ncbi:uncharacterized protein ZK643.6-like [Mytilus trossulus]|uniref:uncharacterized protein ZK643.6-like n=1 Tax=Mytilus trossulus TaxID=6551 RepID=UPI003007012B
MASILLFAALCFLTADGSQAMSLSPSTSTTTSSNCVDATFVNCKDSHVCGDTNLRKYCPVTCGVCITSTKTYSCHDDNVFNCNKNVCGFPSLKKFCRVTCNACGEYGGPGPGGTGIPNNGNCTDLIPNCNEFDLSVCRGTYRDWAIIHCPKYCDLCGSVGSTSSKINTVVGTASTVTCEDRISTCKQYGRYACFDPYADWAKQNCAKFCRFCAQLAP